MNTTMVMMMMMKMMMMTTTTTMMMITMAVVVVIGMATETRRNVSSFYRLTLAQYANYGLDL